jgi:hypothetical protein
MDHREAMKVIFVALLSALPLLPVQAQQENTITLSCNGTAKLTAAADVKPDPVKGLGIVVSASERTVSFQGWTVPIKSVTKTVVTFDGQAGLKQMPFEISGTIDRVTGWASIDFMYEKVGNNSNYELTCHPATRLF